MQVNLGMISWKGYHPHFFYLVVRQEVSDVMDERFRKEGNMANSPITRCLVTAGHMSPFDKCTKDIFNNIVFLPHEIARQTERLSGLRFIRIS